MKNDVAAESELGIFLHPGLSINNITYKGYLEGQDIHNAVCASLRPKPRNCRSPFEEMIDHSGEDERNGIFVEQMEEEGLRQQKRHDGTRVRKHVLWSIFGVVLVF